MNDADLLYAMTILAMANTRVLFESPSIDNPAADLLYRACNRVRERIGSPELRLFSYDLKATILRGVCDTRRHARLASAEPAGIAFPFTAADANPADAAEPADDEDAAPRNCAVCGKEVGPDDALCCDKCSR